MRHAALLLVVAVLALAGCGGSGGSGSEASHTIVGVSKAFSEAGIPFTSLVTSNPYVRGQQVFLPFSLNNSELAVHVLAQLNGSDTSTRNGWIAWVFDSDANAKAAVEKEPLEKWGQGEATITRAIEGNVIVVASGFDGSEKQPLDDALSKLR